MLLWERFRKCLTKEPLYLRNEYATDKWISTGNVYWAEGVEGTMVSRIKHPGI